MKLLFLTSGYLPHPTGNGNCVLMHGILTCFSNLGFQVGIVPVSQRYSNTAEELLHRKSLEKEGFKIYDISPLKKVKSFSKKDQLRMFFKQTASDFFYSKDEEKQELLTLIKKEDIKVLLAYSWEAVGAISTIQNIIKIASIVDLIEDVMAIRWKGLRHYSYKAMPKQLFNLIISRHQSLFAYESLSSMDIIIEHASQHAEKLLLKGFKNVHYIPHPLPLKAVIEPKEKKGKINILISGSLKGIASRLGFEFFLNEVIPRLHRRKGEIKEEIMFRVVGHGAMLPSLQQRLMKTKDVQFIGFVNDLEEEYKTTDIILVNIPVSHGFRTRIAEAFSYGFCVVAHSANAEGMPEMKDEINALLASDPDIFVSKLIRAVNESALRENLGNKAKETFEREISIDAAVKKLSLILQETGLNLKK